MKRLVSMALLVAAMLSAGVSASAKGRRAEVVMKKRGDFRKEIMINGRKDVRFMECRREARFEPRFEGRRFDPRFEGRRFDPRFEGRRFDPRFEPKFVKIFHKHHGRKFRRF